MNSGSPTTPLAGPTGLRIHHAGSLRGTRPLVSICMSTWNQASLTEAAVRSALAQTYAPIEVVVVDDASTDGTAERIANIDDSRIRLHVNPARLGNNANANRALARATGELVKFLDHDDELAPDCVARMIEPFLDDDSVGLAFCRRNVVFDGLSTESARLWLQRYGQPHLGFGDLDAINDGRDLLRRSLAAGIHENWIGEPCCVIVRRSHLRLSGCFGYHERQLPDWSLWLRLMSHSRVAFLDAELATYRCAGDSVSARNTKGHLQWMDRLWILEELATDPDTLHAYPELRALLKEERRQAWRTAARLGRVRSSDAVPPGLYLPYVWFRSRALVGQRPALFAALPATPAATVHG